MKRKAFQGENSRLTVNKNNAFANVAIETVCRHGGPWLDAVLSYIKSNVDVVRDRLSDIPTVDLIEPDGSFSLWLGFSELGLESDDLTAFLKAQAKWAVPLGHAFGPQGAGFARLNIACPRAKLTAAPDRLRSVVSRP